MRVADKLTDLDYVILAALPQEGSRMGYHTYAKQVSILVEELEGVTSSQLGGRLRSLKHLGLVVNVVVPPVSQGAGWQITPDGARLLHTERPHQGATIHHLRGARYGSA